jgi:hypothetical protein
MSPKTPTTPPSPLDEDVSGSVLVENTETGDLFSVTESRDEGELFFENRTNRDTFVGSEQNLLKFFDPIDQGTGPGTDAQRIETDASEFSKAQQFHSGRSFNARVADESKQADVVTSDFDEWAAAPGEKDFPGVDSPEFDPEFR